MTHHKPTFKPTPAQRPWHQRLTPLAWALVVAVVLAIAGGLIAGIWALAQGRDRPFTLPPTGTPAPTAGPTPTSGPSPTPTAWYEGVITPTATVAETATPTATVAYPAWWRDQMTLGDDGQWWPPQEVVQMVAEHYQGFLDEYEALAKANDLDGIVENLPRWYTGDMEAITGIFAAVQAGERPLGYVEWETTLPLQVQDFSEDGLECTLGRVARNGTSYQWIDGQLVAAETNPGGLYLIRVRYDPADGRWKELELLELIDIPEGVDQ
jgi:hypothetical protein